MVEDDDGALRWVDLERVGEGGEREREKEEGEGRAKVVRGERRERRKKEETNEALSLSPFASMTILFHSPLFLIRGRAPTAKNKSPPLQNLFKWCVGG